MDGALAGECCRARARAAKGDADGPESEAARNGAIAGQRDQARTAVGMASKPRPVVRDETAFGDRNSFRRRRSCSPQRNRNVSKAACGVELASAARPAKPVAK